MKLMFLIVSLFASVVSASNFDYGTAMQIEARVHRLTAVELKPYHQKQRIEGPKGHRMYLPWYPQSSITANCAIGPNDYDFYMAFETNVDKFWVFDTTCENASPYVKTFDPTNTSSSTIDINRPFELKGADYNVRGRMYQDHVFFFKNITQNFGSVTEVYGEDNITLSETFAVSGVFGLSWNPALIYESVTPDSAPILNIFARAPKLPRQYSLNYFGRPEYSFLTFGNDTGGCFDHPVITTVPILFDEKTSSLNFQLDSFIFQDVKMGSDLIRIDMGYPVLHFPDSVFNLIYQKLNLDFDYDHEIYTTSCSNKGQFADFVYTINGVNLTATSQNYILDLGLGQDICAVGISNLVSPPVPYVLGLPFLRDYCVKFDIDNTLIEFKLSDDA